MDLVATFNNINEASYNRLRRLKTLSPSPIREEVLTINPLDLNIGPIDILFDFDLLDIESVNKLLPLINNNNNNITINNTILGLNNYNSPYINIVLNNSATINTVANKEFLYNYKSTITIVQ